MNLTRNVEFILSLVLLLSVLIFIVQAIKIFIQKKNTHNFFILPLLGLFLIQIVTIFYVLIKGDLFLGIGFLLSIIACDLVIFLKFLYKKNTEYFDENNISLESIVDQLPGHIYWKSKSFRNLGSNRNNWKDCGFSSLQDYKNKTDYDIFNKEEADKIRAVDEEVIGFGKVITIEEWATTSSLGNALFLSQKKPLYNAKGEIIGLVGVSIDITTAKKEMEDRLEMLENIIAIMPGTVYWMNREGMYLGCNDNEARAIGLSSRKDIIGKRNVDLPGFLIPEVLDPVNEKVMANDKAIILEEPAMLRDGTEATFLSNKVPIHDREGVVVGMVGISIDITERIKIQEALKKAQGQIDGMALVSASIAHELRTPLASIRSTLYSINTYLPKLIAAYYQALSHNLDVPQLNEKILHSLQEATASINKKVDHSNMVIDMLLTNLAHNQINSTDFIKCSIAETVKEAVQKYTFAVGQKKLVKVNITQDFNFHGKSILIVHILFNLFKNALYFIQKARKGDIQIWTEVGETHNSLHFKDTSQGISPEILPHIFDQFFSQDTNHGTGIGLAFSKMVMQAHGGDISCRSVYGEYAEFILTFPINNT